MCIKAPADALDQAWDQENENSENVASMPRLCVQCGADPAYRVSYHGLEHLFCSAECQREHWDALGADVQASIVQINTTEHLGRVGLSKEDMGRAGWAFMHAVAANCGEDGVIPDDKRRYLPLFVECIRALYPCDMCREHFVELTNEPGKQFVMTETTTPEDVDAWFCARHNDVNRRLGKPEVDCAGIGKEYVCID